MFPNTPPIDTDSTPQDNHAYEIRKAQATAERNRKAAAHTCVKTMLDAQRLRDETIAEIDRAERNALAEINRKYGRSGEGE